LSNLFGGSPKQVPEFTGLQVNTSVQVVPIPILYGSPRVHVNLVYYNGFNATTVKQSGGKGVVGGGKGGAGQVEYFATLILAIGEGPIGSPLIIYQDQEVWVPSDYPSNGAYYYNGSATQTPWPYVASLWPADARSYKNTAYYGFSNAQLDSSATVPQINLVVEGFYRSTCPLYNSTITVSTGQYDQNGNPISYIGNIALGDADADPGGVIYDFLLNDVYGAGFPAEWLDASTLLSSALAYDPNFGDQAVSTYCQAVGFGWSLAIANAESANSLLGRLCKNIGVAPVWNGAWLRFIPYWDTYASANPGYDAANPYGIPRKYFNPYTTPCVNIPFDQILKPQNKEDDPITYSRKDPMQVYNTVRVDYRDRNNFFNDNVAEAKDEAHINLIGPRVDNIGKADEFTLGAFAQLSATVQLRRNIAIMREFTWRMSPMWGWLDPMDIVEIPDPANYNSTLVVRVISVEEDDNEDITVTAEEFPVGAQSPSTLGQPATSPPNQGATNVPPSPIAPPVIFCPTSAMLTAEAYSVDQIVTGFTATIGDIFDTNWGGANIWVSLDNVTYTLIGNMNSPSILGSLTQPLPGYSGSNPDNTDSIVVDLAMSNSVLPTVSAAAAAAGYSLCILQDASGFELIAYTTATLTGTDTYTLTGLYRGLYGTTSRLFGAGTKLLAVGQGDNFFTYNLPPSYIGKTLYIKYQSYNVFNTATQDLATCVAYPFYVYGPTYPGNVAVPGINGDYRRRQKVVTPELAKKAYKQRRLKR
jgi:hypothetical protein